MGAPVRLGQLPRGHAAIRVLHVAGVSRSYPSAGDRHLRCECRNGTYIAFVQMTLWRDLILPTPPTRPLPSDLSVVSCDQVSATAMGELQYMAYQRPARPASVEAARDDNQAALDGDYGELIPEASLVVLAGAEPVAVIQTVLRAPWDDVQAGPFIIELFTAPAHQRRGLGRFLLGRSIAACVGRHERWLGLRVDSENVPARTLYHSVGFAEEPVE